VQVAPIKPTLKAPGIKGLKLQYDELLSNVPFKLNLRRYSMAIKPQKDSDEKEVSTGIEPRSTQAGGDEKELSTVIEPRPTLADSDEKELSTGIKVSLIRETARGGTENKHSTDDEESANRVRASECERQRERDRDASACMTRH
jgi:hypothetical protein